ncbi:tyrosine-type recombinase/integrase [Collimonas pratensis]|uniref:tyrosine-type recombinase/integrase n=1 Tax=Collimonas pratensis TaxID=279113 RepID=UPI00143D11ED|nr:site-specific integrase [Collimonas pratensis]NKI70756.1 tyrosine-type recombinase/integrase [Collimonas pratensis]
MATFTQLPSGSWRAQVRRGGLTRGATFKLKREAQDWASVVETQATHIIASGYQPIPKGFTFAHLIDAYVGSVKAGGKTKTATLTMLKRQLGHVALKSLNSVHLRDFIDRRKADGAGGVTLSADLSYIGAVMKWAKHSRQMDVSTELALNARRDLTSQGISTRSNERSREPTKSELEALFHHWQGNERQRIPMHTIVEFALSSAMRLSEICSITAEDVKPSVPSVLIRDRKDPRKKDGNHQDVALLPAAWDIVAPILKERPIGKLFPYQPSSVSTAFTRACAKLQITDLHFHDLRHAAASNLFRIGLDIPHVASITGHKDWKMLKRYTHITPSDVFAKLKK